MSHEIVVWIEQDESLDDTVVSFRVRMTGQAWDPIGDCSDDRFVGTVQCRDGIVAHVYGTW